MNNRDLATRIMEDLNELIDRRGNTRLIPALVLVKEFRDEVDELRGMARALEDAEDTYGIGWPD